MKQCRSAPGAALLLHVVEHRGQEQAAGGPTLQLSRQRQRGIPPQLQQHPLGAARQAPQQRKVLELEAELRGGSSSSTARHRAWPSGLSSRVMTPEEGLAVHSVDRVLDCAAHSCV